MEDYQSVLPPPGSSVRLTRKVRMRNGIVVYTGERGRVTYDYDEDRPPLYGVILDDPPPGSEDWAGILWFDDRDEFLYAVEPEDLGND